MSSAQNGKALAISLHTALNAPTFTSTVFSQIPSENRSHTDDRQVFENKLFVHTTPDRTPHAHEAPTMIRDTTTRNTATQRSCHSVCRFSFHTHVQHVPPSSPGCDGPKREDKSEAEKKPDERSFTDSQQTRNRRQKSNAPARKPVSKPVHQPRTSPPSTSPS